MEYEQHEQTLLNEWVISQESARLGAKTTVVCLQMDNGYEVLGSSSCIDPDDYDEEIGVFYATKDALRNLKLIVGYVHQEEHNLS